MSFSPYSKRDDREERSTDGERRASDDRRGARQPEGRQRSSLPTPRKVVAVNSAKSAASSRTTLSRKPVPRKTWRDNDDDYID